MDAVQAKLKEILDPLSHLKEQIQSIEGRLRERRKDWENKEVASVEERGRRFRNCER